VRPQVEHIQLPRKIWQAVTEHALRELTFRESQDAASRIENLRPCHIQEETDVVYGRQMWCFESTSGQHADGKRIEFGALEFSIEYGLLELIQCCWFENDQQRDDWIYQRLTPDADSASGYGMTKVWIYLAILGVLFLAIGWTVSLLRFLNVTI